MRREDCHIGMKVIFGRGQGEKTSGVVRKLNPKKAKVETLENRGGLSKVGQVWGVPYCMMEPDPNENDVSVGPQIDSADESILMADLMAGYDVCIMEAILCVYSDLSPENLACDGELPLAQVRRRGRELQSKLKRLFAALGRSVSESVAYEWHRQKQESEKEQERIHQRLADLR
jgi:hypothetical protein